jgi:hypothetical protein
MAKIRSAFLAAEGVQELADAGPERFDSRSVALRNSALSLANSSSIGLRSGE